MALFQKKKERAVAFVDFEYMQISFRKKFFLNPPLKEWYADISERFTIDDVFFFADFSNPAMKYNIPQIRRITNNVIDTQNTSLRRKKDFTDFFILDAIYRTAFDKNSAKNIILFSGDGHFSAAVRFLREKCAKRVIVYGIENTVSAREIVALLEGLYGGRLVSPEASAQMLEILRNQKLNGKITLFSGNSGVGKSTIINSLIPGANLRTAEISDAHNQGTHTTTFSEMLALPEGGYLIDTPGIKGFGTFDMEPEELTGYFKEIFRFSKDCRFSNCTHTHEPGCAVRQAVEEHYISESRYRSYLSMLEDKEEGKYREAF